MVLPAEPGPREAAWFVCHVHVGPRGCCQLSSVHGARGDTATVGRAERAQGRLESVCVCVCTYPYKCVCIPLYLCVLYVYLCIHFNNGSINERAPVCVCVFVCVSTCERLCAS